MSTDHCCRIDKAIDRYDLTPPKWSEADGYNEYLAARWTGTGARGSLGIRPLATEHDEQIVRAANQELDPLHRLDPQAVPLATRLVRGEDTTGLDDPLEAKGFDVDELEWFLIERSTIRRHVNHHLDAEKESEESDLGDRIDGVRNVERHAVDEAGDLLARAYRAGVFDGPDSPTATVEVQATCPVAGCDTTKPAKRALRTGSVCADHRDESTD